MTVHSTHQIPLRNDVLALGPMPLIMGILNVTPDSFSDGGEYTTLNLALRHTKTMLEEGADLIDIGGESTRPGANEVTTQHELDRVIPVIQHLVAAGIKVPLSIDTYKAVVADQAIQAGASIINDVHGLQREPEMADVAALYGTPVVIMHWDRSREISLDLIGEMKRYFEKSIAIADKAGIERKKLILDPGFGFGKTHAENFELLRRLDELTGLGYPLLIGTSRKSMLGTLLDVPAKERVVATAATSVLAYEKGAHLFRVHDVKENRQALQVAVATRYGPPLVEGP